MKTRTPKAHLAIKEAKRKLEEINEQWNRYRDQERMALKWFEIAPRVRRQLESDEEKAEEALRVAEEAITSTQETVR